MVKKIAVIDYGMSNLRSVSKALEYVAGNNWQVRITREDTAIRDADKIVFPGQGAIGNCMQLLNQSTLKESILHAIDNKPFLGLCLGLQTLLTFSEESGGTPCFNKVAGTVKRFPDQLSEPTTGERLKIPHMGWNQVFPAHAHFLWTGIPENSWFYFVHSYFADPDTADAVAGTTDYGNVRFASAVAYDNVFAVQFHPEKSQQAGLTLLRNFLAW